MISFKDLDIVDVLRIYTITGTNFNRMSSIAVSKRWSTRIDEKRLLEACEELSSQTNGYTKQFEFACNVQAFIENSKNYVHKNNNTVLLKDFLDDESRVYLASYEYKKPEDDEEENDDVQQLL